jgi:DNA-binding transcriptional LysR family regulator
VDAKGLRAFLAVAEAGSISKGAKRLGQRRPALQRRITAFESELGHTLFVRERRGVRPTDFGASILADAADVLRRWDDLSDRLRSERALVGLVRHVVSVGLAPPAFAGLMGISAGVLAESRLEVFVSEDPISHLGDTADLAWLLGEEPPEGPWRVATIRRLRERLWASEAYLQRWGTPTSLAELSEHRVMLWNRPGRPVRHLPLRDGGTHPIDPWTVTNDPWFVQRSVEAGAVLGLCPQGPLPAKLHQAPTLVPVLEHIVSATCPLRVVLPTGAFELPSARQTMALLRTMLEAP